MICEKCKNNDATIHLTEIIKDVKSEIHLCESCAREIGLNSKLSNFSLSIPEMLSFLDLNEVDRSEESHLCSSCGYSFLDFNKNGKLGCPDCYINLRDQLTAVIISFHGTQSHSGKHPNNVALLTEVIPKEIPKDFTIEELHKMLDDAILDENYEVAAELRDKIKELKELGVKGD